MRNPRPTFAAFLFVLAAAGLAPAQAPPNDDCVNAIALVDGPNGPYTNVGATDNPADPPFSCSTGSIDIWFTYTASCSGELVFSMCPAQGGTWDYDAMLSIYTGTCGALVETGCNDDFCQAFATGSQVTVYCVQAGQSFLVRAGGWTGEVGIFTLAVNCLTPPPPANDDCAGALPIVDGPNPGLSSVGGTTNAADPPFSCVAGGGDVWYSYTATCTGATTFSLCGTPAPLPLPLDPVLAVYGAGCGSPALLGCSNDACGVLPQVSVPTVNGSTYLVRVGGAGTCPVTGSFSIDVTCAAPPANDECAAATPVVDGVNGPFDNTNATSGSVSAGCGASGTPGHRDVWFSYTASCSGAVTVHTCDTLSATTTLADTVVTVYDACGGTELACGDNHATPIPAYCTVGAPTGLSSAAFSATAGASYRIRVASGTPVVQGTFTVTVTCSPDAAATADFGDSPGGFVASHTGPLEERLGASVTADAGTRTPGWFGDAGDDGIVSVSNLFPGSTSAQIVVSAVNPVGTQTDRVRLWVRRSSTDLGWNNLFDGLPSQTASVGAAPVNFTFGPFTHSATGAPSPAVRVRLSRNSTGVALSVGTGAFGEVEDYVVAGSGGANTAPIAGSPGSDAGDAPVPYPPAATKNVTAERLGVAIDADANAPVGFPTAGAAAWNDEGSDDDGIVKLSGMRPGGSLTLLVRGTNPASIANPSSSTVPASSTLDAARAWFDFNNNGNWDEAGESSPAKILSISVGPAGTTFTLGPLAVPAGAPNQVPTRIKLSRANGNIEGGHFAAGASGTHGEVEDYLLTLQQGLACNTSGGPPPSAWADDPPRLGGNFTWKQAGLAPGAPVLFVLSASLLPGIDFVSFGLPIPPGQCFLYVPPSVLATAGVADGSGNLSTTVPVANNPALLGGTVNLQNVQLAPPFVLYVTNYLALTILPG